MDYFGEPISLYYKGENSHKTRFGGVCSVIWIALVLTNLGIELYQLYLGSSFTQLITYDYIPIGAEDKDKWRLETAYETIAAMIEPAIIDDDSLDPETLARVQFYYQELDENGTDADYSSLATTFVPAARCKDLYAEMMDPSSPDFDPTIE